MFLIQADISSIEQKLECPSYSSYNTMQLKAHYATSSTNTTTPSWRLDSGAFHQVIFDLTNLYMHTSYNGLDDIIIGVAQVSLLLIQVLFLSPLLKILFN